MAPPLAPMSWRASSNDRSPPGASPASSCEYVRASNASISLFLPLLPHPPSGRLMIHRQRIQVVLLVMKRDEVSQTTVLSHRCNALCVLRKHARAVLLRTLCHIKVFQWSREHCMLRKPSATTYDKRTKASRSLSASVLTNQPKYALGAGTQHQRV